MDLVSKAKLKVIAPFTSQCCIWPAVFFSSPVYSIWSKGIRTEVTSKKRDLTQVKWKLKHNYLEHHAESCEVSSIRFMNE